MIGQHLEGQRMEKLHWLEPDDLFTMLRTPKDTDRIALVMRLCNVSNRNQEEGGTIIRGLPYVLFGRFNPMTYRPENYAGSDYLCLDICHFPCLPDEPQFREWRQKLQSDRNVSMSFLSADATCLHLIFKLRKRCYDIGLFRLFYRSFAQDFFSRHELREDIYHKSSDPCKMIPIGLDSETYYCIGSTPLRFEDYVNSSSLDDLYEKQKRRREASKVKRKKLIQSPEIAESQIFTIKKILYTKDKK